MMGSNKLEVQTEKNSGGSAQSASGMYILAARDIFKALNELNRSGHVYSIYISFFEIYGNKLYDLLNGRRQLKTQADHQDNICVPGLHVLRIFLYFIVISFVAKTVCKCRRNV